MNILIVKLSSMGDVICTLPALTDASKAIGDIKFDWVVEENFVEIPHWHHAVQEVIPINLRCLKRKPWQINAWRNLFSCWRQLKVKNYDYILDVQGLLKSAWVSCVARGVRCGYNAASAREPLAAFFYQHQFNISKDLHAVGRIRQLFAQALGYKMTVGNPDYGVRCETFHCSTEEDHAKYLVFIHGTSRENKCWQEEKWIELAHLAKNVGFLIKLPWGNATELARARKIAEAASNVEVLPRVNLTTMGQILMCAQGVVTLDTGFGHLSAACGVPTVALYGPTDPQLAGTYGTRQKHLINMANLGANNVWQVLQSMC